MAMVLSTWSVPTRCVVSDGSVPTWTYWVLMALVSSFLLLTLGLCLVMAVCAMSCFVWICLFIWLVLCTSCMHMLCRETHLL